MKKTRLFSKIAAMALVVVMVCCVGASAYGAATSQTMTIQGRDGKSYIGYTGLIDQNDYSTVTFCAHTNCRRSKPVSFLSYKNYFVPYYDSYGGTWVNP